VNLFRELHDLCIEKQIYLATAESCTAGLLASSIVSISGASLFFKGGVIAYHNDIKIKILGVSKSNIDKKTEVCSEVVEQMAEGVRERLAVDFSLATSGYAGPGGGTELNPTGTIFIAVSSNERTISKRFLFTGDRQSVINKGTVKAVELLLQELKKSY